MTLSADEESDLQAVAMNAAAACMYLSDYLLQKWYMELELQELMER